jgi:hypothetical protein
VLLINVFPALLCAAGFAVGLAVVRRPVSAGLSSWRVALAVGLVFPLSLRLLRPLFGLVSAGMVPALAWCVLVSAGAGALLAAWERRG